MLSGGAALLLLVNSGYISGQANNSSQFRSNQVLLNNNVSRGNQSVIRNFRIPNTKLSLSNTVADNQKQKSTAQVQKSQTPVRKVVVNKTQIAQPKKVNVKPVKASKPVHQSQLNVAPELSNVNQVQANQVQPLFLINDDHNTLGNILVQIENINIPQPQAKSSDSWFASDEDSSDDNEGALAVSAKPQKKSKVNTGGSKATSHYFQKISFSFNRKVSKFFAKNKRLKSDPVGCFIWS